MAAGSVWLVAALAVWLASFDLVRAGDPAYAALLAALAAAGAALLASGMRRGTRRVRSQSRPAVLTLAAWTTATAVAVGGVVWLRPFAPAPEAVAAMAGAPGVTVTDAVSEIVLSPAKPAAGLVFQPGARVDPRAYVPLLTGVAQAGYLVVIVKQPLGIGFLSVDAPTAIRRDRPGIGRWAVGGHSLGGVAAASYAAGADVTGLVLWASYPAASLTHRTGLRVVSISGTQDGLSTPAKVSASRALLPATTTFVAIDGAVHAYFGDYGPQPGDGTPTVTRAAAQGEIVRATVALMDSL